MVMKYGIMRTPKSAPPAFDSLDIVPFIAKTYGLTVSANRLNGYIGQNFVLEDNSGIKYILKVADPSEHRDTLEAQNSAMAHVAARCSTFVCPKIIPSLSGDHISPLCDRDNNSYHARLLTFVHGTFLVDREPHSQPMLESIGEALATMDKALTDFRHPGAQRKLQWDLINANEVAPLTVHLASPAQRRLAAYFFQQFEMMIMPKLKTLPRSVIHNDANEHNLLIGPEKSGAARLSGIIDFGDLVYTHTLFEPAIAIAYAMLGKQDPLEAAAAVIRGYNRTLPFAADEIELLFHLACTRLATSVTLSNFDQKQQPENDYLTISAQPAWDVLDKLIATNPLNAHRQFREACGMLEPAFQGIDKTRTRALRDRYIGKSLSTSYQQPLKIIRGAMQYLFDDEGKTYLDCVNNISHVGHCHPRVIRAVSSQMACLNTNTRYLHDNLVHYAELLAATLPDPLEVCFFVNSGSEANELAIRLAKAHTGGTHFIVVDHAYHGNTSSLIELSPYKFDGAGGSGGSAHVAKVPIPDLFRGPFKMDDPEAGLKYARAVEEAIHNFEKQQHSPAGFICESLPGCGGQIVFPPDYLKNAFGFVKEAGGVCIADEVQVGFGRTGSHFWGFETQGVVPDIVTIGKPAGNGHPLGAVVTTHEIADSFCNGMEYFNSFGGNPVSCAAGLAVLDTIKKEKLQDNARDVGQYLLKGLSLLKHRHPIIGDVRGTGLFIGIELISDRTTLSPAPEAAAYIAEALMQRQILISVDGPCHNVLKVKPPMVFTAENADLLLKTLEAVISSLPVSLH